MPQYQALNIAIVGSGLAGLAAARVLREQHNVTVYERGSRHVATGGQGIMIAPNGGNILDRLGWDRSRAGGVPIYGLRSYADGGSDLKEDALLNLKDHFGSDYTALKRSQFRDELFRLATAPSADLGITGEPANIIMDTSVTKMNANAGTLSIEDGSEAKFDALIVADGIHSRLRNSILKNDEHTARKTGLTCYRIAVRNDDVHTTLGEVKAPHWWNSETGSNRCSIIYAGDDSRRVIVAYPMADATMFNLSCIIQTPESKKGTAEAWHIDADRDEMVGLFGDVDDGLKRVLLAAKEVKVWELQDLDPIPQWACGRAIVIGDAAHAMTPMQGQGANMAIEDAEGLSLLLGAHVTREAVPNLLKQVESVRRPRLARVLEATRQVHSTRGLVENMIANLEFNCSYAGIQKALEELGHSPGVGAA